MKKEVLDNLQMIFIIESVGYQNNGIVESVLRKVKFIEDAWGHRPIILVAAHNIGTGLLEYHFSEGGQSETQTRLNANTRMFGVFDYFQNSYPYNQGHEMKTYPKRGDKRLQYKEISVNVFEVYDGGVLLRKEYFTAPGGSLHYIETFDKQRRKTKTITYDHLGYANKIQVWDLDNQNYHPTEYYYNINGKLRIKAEYIYLEDHLNSKYLANRIYKANNELTGYTFYNDDGAEVGWLETHQELLGACLEGLIRQSPDKKYIVYDEAALWHGSGTFLKRDNVVTSTVVHSVVLEDPYNLKSAPQPFFKYLCENRKSFDGIVMLTKEAAKDFAAKYEPTDRLHVITHPYPFPVRKADFAKRDLKKTVVISRLDPIKRITDMVEIMSMVRKDVPDVIFDIYGTGQDHENIVEMIKKCNAEGFIKMKGYTDKAAEVLRESACFLFTSDREGLGITLLESVSNGCPVFSYDLKYGPATVVRNNVTGVLVKLYDKKAMAKALVKFFKNPDMQRRMSDNCYEDANRFSVEVFLQKWWDLTESLYRKMEART